MQFAHWNQGLLVSAIYVVMGGMLLVSASSLRHRMMAVGVLSQAIMLALATQGPFYGRHELQVAAIVMAMVFILWGLLAVCGETDDPSSPEKQDTVESNSAVDPSLSVEQQ